MNRIFFHLMVITQEYISRINDWELLKSLMEDFGIESFYVKDRNRFFSEEISEERIKEFEEAVREFGIEVFSLGEVVTIEKINEEIRKVESEIFKYLRENGFDEAPLPILILESRI